jgi:cation:H+ antiporter
VTGAEQIALGLGASQTVIGLTIVAAGSSLPELATSLAAAVRGHTDVAIGNVLGSCIFNVLWILGLCAIVRPFAIESSLAKEAIFVMLGTSIVVSLLLLARARVGRFAGAVLSLAYAAYVVIFVRAS